MGFITPTHTWEETDTELTVRVQVKGVPRSSFDVFGGAPNKSIGEQKPLPSTPPGHESQHTHSQWRIPFVA